METLGIDVGGSGIKGAPVDFEAGDFAADRIRIPTPQPATPQAVAEVVAEIVKAFPKTKRIGFGLPAIIRRQTALTAANIDDSWIGTDAAALFREATGMQCAVINDADAAGLAEMEYGAARGLDGTVVLLTLGTGIGSALFHNGQLFPNSEFGHLELKGGPAEKHAAASVREEEDLSWEEWAKRLNRYLKALERIIAPDHIIIGGGISKKHKIFFPLLKTRASLLPAELLNRAGIVGAALATKHPPV